MRGARGSRMRFLPQTALPTAPSSKGAKAAGKALRTIVVAHPIHGEFKAAGVRDKLQAVQAAAKAWGGLQWSKIAKECTFTDDLDSA